MPGAAPSDAGLSGGCAHKLNYPRKGGSFLHIEQMGVSTVKIALTAEEMQYFDLDATQMDSTDTATRQTLLSILRYAQRKTKLPFDSSKLMIESFPEEDGGCFLYVHLSPEENGAVERLSNFPCTLTYQFHSFYALGAACVRLRRQFETLEDSILYQQNGRYVLKLLCMSRQLGAIRLLLNEYGTVCRSGWLADALLREHGKLLIDEDAIGKIAEVF